MRSCLLGFLCVLFSCQLSATVDVYDFSNQENYERYRELTEELRCPKCQNQNIADSDAQIAKDLRREVYRMVEEGQSDDQVVRFMVDRYGEFVHYRPSMHGMTFWLWATPVLLVLIALPLLFFWVRRRNQGVIRSDDKMLDAEKQARLEKLLAESRSQREE